MKKIIIIFILIIILSFLYILQRTLNETEQKIITKTPSVSQTIESIEATGAMVEKRSSFTFNGVKLQYLIMFPSQYAQTKNQWPLIFYLHGSSLRGEDLELVKSYGPPWVIEQQPDFPFIVLAPQCPEGEEWTNNPDILIKLLEDVSSKYRIDKGRVYLTGTSMGGKGTWYLANKYPEYFAAIAPLAAHPILPTTWKKNFITMPIWAFHGDQDQTCLLQYDEAMINAIRQQGGSPRFTILSGQGHYIAGIYKNQQLYDWFLTNAREH